jgi:hypothetical protein
MRQATPCQIMHVHTPPHVQHSLINTHRLRNRNVAWDGADCLKHVDQMVVCCSISTLARTGAWCNYQVAVCGRPAHRAEDINV